MNPAYHHLGVFWAQISQRSKSRRSYEPTEASKHGNWAQPLLLGPTRHLGLNHSLRKERKKGAQERRSPSRKTAAGRADGINVIMGAVFLCLINGRGQGKQYLWLYHIMSQEENPPNVGLWWVVQFGWAWSPFPGLSSHVLPASAFHLPTCWLYSSESQLPLLRISLMCQVLETLEGVAACPSLWRP